MNKTVQYNKTLNKNELWKHEIYVKQMKYSKALNGIRIKFSNTDYRFSHLEISLNTPENIHWIAIENDQNCYT